MPRSLQGRPSLTLQERIRVLRDVLPKMVDADDRTEHLLRLLRECRSELVLERNSRFNVDQIVAILREADRTSVVEATTTLTCSGSTLPDRCLAT